MNADQVAECMDHLEARGYEYLGSFQRTPTGGYVFRPVTVFGLTPDQLQILVEVDNLSDGEFTKAMDRLHTLETDPLSDAIRTHRRSPKTKDASVDLYTCSTCGENLTYGEAQSTQLDGMCRSCHKLHRLERLAAR